MKQQPGSLLIVDDDDMAREILRRRLSAQGYSVAEAPSGREAMALVKKTAFDVLLLDIVMPEFDGLQTLVALREIRPANELPVIMLTAKEGSDDVVEALRLGANDYVTKSIPFSVVLARIQTQVTLRRLVARVEALAVQDSLTGLYNRRGFYQLAEKEEQRVKRYGGTLQAIMVDMDHFKKINDTYGHKVGDEVLAVTSRCCQQHLRTVDLIGRWGGEEYAILLPGIDVEGAVKTAERLRSVVADAVIDGDDGAIKVTLSAGVASLDETCADLGALLSRADKAMYDAKRGGRNRVCLFEAAEG